MKKLSIKYLNSDERDFAFKDLTNSQFDSFCYALTQWELATFYWFAEELLGKNSTDEEKKKHTTEIFDYKISLLEEKLSELFSKMVRLVSKEYLVNLVEQYYKEQQRNYSFCDHTWRKT